MTMKGFDTDNPLLAYATDHLWGNPEENNQYQVRTVRLSDYYGDVDNFSFMGKWRSLPKRDTFYYVFSVGGLDAGYWNFHTNLLKRNPLDRWMNLAELCKRRGVQLDIYNTKGYQYSRNKAWVMMTYDKLTFIALEKYNTYPMPTGQEMFFRCYTASSEVAKNEQTANAASNPYVYETMVYESQAELAVFNNRYLACKGKPGFTGVTVNGVYWHGNPGSIPNLVLGDVVEFFHDPTVIRTELYAYNTLQDFYSTLDKKRKLILHPPKRPGDFTLRYFDDNDYYLLGKGSTGLYFHRNAVSTIRQLTHVDVAIADDQIQAASNYHKDLSEVKDIRILVLVRKTDWEYSWPHDNQRIRYLYRMTDENILKAMTGDRATVPEWTAPNLEAGVVMSFTRSQMKALTVEGARKAVGYNAATRVLSETPLKAVYEAGGRGVEIPISYRVSCTAWEHDENGCLLEYHNVNNIRYYAPRNPKCQLVEFTCGQYGRTLDYVVTNTDLPLDPFDGFRVYTSHFNVDRGEITGELTDVTGDKKIYEVVNEVLVWKGLDPVNQRGVVVFNTRTLAYGFELDHIDHSLSFAITHIYEPGGLAVPLIPAQIDIWMNGHPLIDNVDWIFDNGYCYIINKQFIRPGAQQFVVRCHDLWEDKERPKVETELGFVDGGVIGRFKRYNLREDRVTRTVIGGRLVVTDDVPTAELSSPDNLWNHLNGLPYMVKHVFQPIKYVVPYDNFPGYKESREIDQRVSDYLTEYCPKPLVDPVIPTLQDKYRLFSPFLNVVVNAIKNRLLVVPNRVDGEETYSPQFIEEQVSPYKWWLKYDPVIREYDLRYFAVMPYANDELLSVTPNQFVFIKQVNDLYLKSVCVIEGHFEVSNSD